MTVPKYLLDSALIIGGNDIDIYTLKDLRAVPIDEEIARMICSVSSRPDRNGL